MTKERLPTDRPLPNDPPEMIDAIGRLNDLGIRFVRATRFQLKIGRWNFYPAKGTVFCDGSPAAESDRGFDALVTTLQRDPQVGPRLRGPKFRINHKLPDK